MPIVNDVPDSFFNWQYADMERDKRMSDEKTRLMLEHRELKKQLQNIRKLLDMQGNEEAKFFIISAYVRHVTDQSTGFDFHDEGDLNVALTYLGLK